MSRNAQALPPSTSASPTTVDDELSPLSSGGTLPSSLEEGFFEESRSQKLFRKIRQEPLIPLGCLATCYALFQASQSIRKGNPTRTNKMFRARIYAQGFTLAAIVAGSFFYRDERMQRKKFEGKEEEKKQLEKREKWLAELEARDQEDREWRERIEKQSRAKRPGAKSAEESQAFPAKSMVDNLHRRSWWGERTAAAWRRA